MPHPDVRSLEGKERWTWILRSGLLGRCPRCGEGKMFDGLLKLQKRCPACDLDYSYASPDDGPAFFVMCFVTIPVVFFAMWVELSFNPPWWVHLLTSIPLMIAGCVLGIRPIKGVLVASQYVNRAQEAGTEALAERLDRGGDQTGGTTP